MLSKKNSLGRRIFEYEQKYLASMTKDTVTSQKINIVVPLLESLVELPSVGLTLLQNSNTKMALNKRLYPPPLSQQFGIVIIINSNSQVKLFARYLKAHHPRCNCPAKISSKYLLKSIEIQCFTTNSEIYNLER